MIHIPCNPWDEYIYIHEWLIFLRHMDESWGIETAVAGCEAPRLHGFCPHGPLGRWAPRLPLSPPQRKDIPKQKLLVKGRCGIFQGYVGEILDK